jgi:AraC-like DNA-binding protein
MKVYFGSQSTGLDGAFSVEIYGSKSRETEFMERLRQLLNEKAFNPRYSIPRLCKDLGMSSSQLHRKLVAATGKSAVKIIQTVRLNYAKQLLAQQQDIPVSEVAYACGFEDSDYFSRLFARQVGVPPTGFRKLSTAILAERA